MKENFAILTDAGGDFTREQIKKYGIEETPLSTVVWPDGTEKPTDLYWAVFFQIFFLIKE